MQGGGDAVQLVGIQGRSCCDGPYSGCLRSGMSAAYSAMFWPQCSNLQEPCQPICLGWSWGLCPVPVLGPCPENSMSNPHTTWKITLIDGIIQSPSPTESFRNTCHTYMIHHNCFLMSEWTHQKWYTSLIKVIQPNILFRLITLEACLFINNTSHSIYAMTWDNNIDGSCG